MSESISNIQHQITSDSEAVLSQSLDFAYRCRQRETDRGKAAEVRASATLATLGVTAVLVVPQAALFVNVEGVNFWFLAVNYLASLAFLMKGIFFSLRVLGVSQPHRVEVDSLLELQGSTSKDALRAEIAWAVWECKLAVTPNTTKLWSLSQSQRSGILAILALSVFGVTVLVTRKLSIDVHIFVSAILGVAWVLLLFFESKVFNRIRWSRIH